MSIVILRRRKLGRKSCRGICEASITGIKCIRNDAAIPSNIDLLIRWGCTSTAHATKVLNKAEAIHAVGDKSGFRRVLNAHDLCPKTWFSLDATDFTYPLVVRPQVHAQGRKLHVCKTNRDLAAASMLCGPGWYASEFIDKVAEYRVFVCQGRAVWVTSKTPADPSTVAWNVAQGGRFDNVRWDDWPLKAVRVSIEAFNLSGLDFGGVDVMVDREGCCYVLEINSAPSQTSPYRQQCVAKAFDYIVRNGTDHIPLTPARGGYKKFIHPALTDQAIVA